MTVGWIREKDEERFFEARYPVVGSERLQDKRLQCPFCSERFDDVRSIYDHLHSAHTLPRPFLLIRGREPNSHDLIAEEVGPSDVSLINCSHIQLALDAGALQECSAVELLGNLASKRSGTARIRLVSGEATSSPVGQDYVLRFRVADDAELATVDRLFVSRLGMSGPHLNSVEEFLSDVGQGPWGDYAAALADYVVGVLSKDKDPRTGVRPPYVDYTEHFRRALSVLDKYDRPLSYLLASIVRFALNDFQVRDRTGFLDLDTAMCLLQHLSSSADSNFRLSTDLSSDRRDGTKDVCPVDAGTSQVLSICRRLTKLDRWTSLEARMATSVDDMAILGPLDRSKLIALLSFTALRLDQSACAVPLLQRLTGNDSFATWAENELEGLTEK